MQTLKSFARAALTAWLVLLISWLLAMAWSSSSDWWFRVQPDALLRLWFALVGPFLASYDIVLAEIQFEFSVYLATSLIVVSVCAGLRHWYWRRRR